MSEGEDVVIDGTDRLDEGTLVRVRKPGELDAIAAGSGRGRGGRGRAADVAGGGGAVGANSGASSSRPVPHRANSPVWETIPAGSATSKAAAVSRAGKAILKVRKAGALRSESLPRFHSKASRDFADDGRRGPGRRGGLPAIARLSAASGRLPDHTGHDFLSRRRSGSHDVGRYRALEKQFGQVPGLTQMTSISSFGSSLITLQFSLDLSIDIAEQEVQAAINAAGTFLPTTLPVPPVYNKANPADAPILTLAITSTTLPLPKVVDLAETRMAQRISQLKGVGLVSISGGQRPAVRVQANPVALASYGLSLDTLRTALGSANVNQAKGNFDGPTQAWTINDNDQLQSGKDYTGIIIAYRNGAPVRLSDVATIIDGAEDTHKKAWVNDTPAIVLNIQRQPGTNIIGVVDTVTALLPQIRASLPQGVNVQVITDRTTTIRASVADVEFELMLTIALVVMVIFLFLRSLTATIIPGIAVPLSLVGTFGVMYMLGYAASTTCR